MPLAVLMKPFAEWLEAELAARSMTQAKLAAYMGTGPSVVNAWLKGRTRPSTELCAALSRVLHIPYEVVLEQAGHGNPDAPIPEPELPGWLTEILEKLNLDELRVVDATARGLLRVREEPSTYEASPPAAPPPPPPA